MDVCRSRVHKWGRINRVAFDPSKEHVVIIHPIYGSGDPFKILGCMIDCKLIMSHAADKILSQVRPKVAAILRTKMHYSKGDLISQCKTHIWGIVEQHTEAIFHASDHVLEKIDRVQSHFLRDLDMTEKAAFLEFNFAPPKLRRNIGILGLLHKRILGRAHPIFDHLFPFHAHRYGELRPVEHTK